MQTLWRILPFFQVLICVEMKTKTGNTFAGTEGEMLEISCKYSDGYQNSPQYFCRDPCGYSDVLIKTLKADKVVSKGRYSILNTVSARSISVTIKNLRLTDSGVYYCGADAWGRDPLTKVVVTVRRKVMTTTAPLSNENTEGTEQPSAATVTHSTAAQSNPMTTTVPLSNYNTTKEFFTRVEFLGVVFGLLLCCVILAFVIFCRRRRRSNIHTTSLKPPAPESQFSDPPLDQEVFHVYDEMLAVYSLAGPAHTESSSEAYSVIRYTPPVEEGCPLYSLIIPH